MRGGQCQVLYLLQGLAKRGIECRLLAPATSPLFAAATTARLDTEPLVIRRLIGHAQGCDLLHAHDAHAHTFALLLARPLIVSRRVAFPIKRTPFSWLKYRRPIHFLAVSQYVQTELVQAGIPATKVSVVYDGVHVPDRMSPLSGPVVALDSDDPAKGKAMIEQASRLAGIPVHFSQALQRDLSEAALFVYITELEGLGSAALLAMSYGVPVLASRAGGLPEIVEPGVTGLPTPNDPAAIAERMRLIKEDPGLAMRLGRNGRASIERGFTVDHMVEKTLKAYERVVVC